LEHREGLHGRFRRIAELVTEGAVARCDWVVADAVCHRVFGIDPLTEPVHRALMRSLAA